MKWLERLLLRIPRYRRYRAEKRIKELKFRNRTKYLEKK